MEDEGFAKVERFEDLRVWQAARQSVAEVYRVSSDRAFSRDFALRDQMRRAAVSISSDIAEGFSRRSNREFVQFLFIAKGSLAEVQSQLYVALDQDYISPEAFDTVHDKLESTTRQLSRLITYLRRSAQTHELKEPHEPNEPYKLYEPHEPNEPN